MACFRRTAVVASSTSGGSCIDSRKKASGSAWPKARTCFVYSSHSGAISRRSSLWKMWKPPTCASRRCSFFGMKRSVKPFVVP